MLDPKTYLASLQEIGVSFYSGVPDSLLKSFCACVTDTVPKSKHIIAANEGAALGLAIGHHLGNNEVPLVYLQNSGLGNLVNPLLSLASEEVYSIPMILMIGWRGEPGVNDEPQHRHQGRVTESLLAAMGIASVVLSENSDEAKAQTNEAVKTARENRKPFALLIRKGLFSSYEPSNEGNRSQADLPLTREDAIIAMAKALPEETVVVSTTGMASRELFEYRKRSGQGGNRDFLTVGGMGHANQIALGIAMSNPDCPVVCIDGDGAAIMHMGSLAVSAQQDIPNYTHILLNNGSHESVGGQATVGFDIEFLKIAEGCGYSHRHLIKTEDELASFLESDFLGKGYFVEIQVRPGHREDLGRPTSTPIENKEALMAELEKQLGA